jgi:hypothetical protein
MARGRGAGRGPGAKERDEGTGQQKTGSEMAGPWNSGALSASSSRRPARDGRFAVGRLSGRLHLPQMHIRMASEVGSGAYQNIVQNPPVQHRFARETSGRVGPDAGGTHGAIGAHRALQPCFRAEQRHRKMTPVHHRRCGATCPGDATGLGLVRCPVPHVPAVEMRRRIGVARRTGGEANQQDCARPDSHAVVTLSIEPIDGDASGAARLHARPRKWACDRGHGRRSASPGNGGKELIARDVRCNTARTWVSYRQAEARE